MERGKKSNRSTIGPNRPKIAKVLLQVSFAKRIFSCNSCYFPAGLCKRSGNVG